MIKAWRYHLETPTDDYPLAVFYINPAHNVDKVKPLLALSNTLVSHD